jgi:nitrous oxide reductase accessory protein NosL
LANRARQDRQQGCALDGVRIEPIYRVSIVDDQQHAHEFCCVRCAELWLERQATQPTGIYLTDEASGEEIEAGRAFFVRSSVITKPTTGNRIHVFQQRGDAEKHAARFGGRLLPESERPFGARP